MFGNLGISELVIIAGIALVVLGPEKFPEYAKIALRAYRDFRGYIDDIKKEMAEEITPIKREIQQLSRFNPEDYVEGIAKAVTDAIEDKPKTEDSKPPETTEGTVEGTPAETGAVEGAAASPASDESVAAKEAEAADAGAPAPEEQPSTETAEGGSPSSEAGQAHTESTPAPEAPSTSGQVTDLPYEPVHSDSDVSPHSHSDH